MKIEEQLDRLYPQLRIGKKCSNPNCNHPAEHCHHIVRRNVDLLRYDVKNLLPLCSKCHSEIHDKGLYNRGLDFVSSDVADYLNQMKYVDFKQYLLEHNQTKEEFFTECTVKLLVEIGKTEIKQNTSEWMEEKNYGIGASEIAAVIKSCVSKERLCEIMGEKPAQNFINEKLYSTGYSVYHKIKRGYRIEPLPDELSAYGHAMEKYAGWFLKNNPNFSFTNTQDFIKRPDISKYTVCSPDGYAEAKQPMYYDINNIPLTEKNLAWEIKTVNPYKAMKENIFYNGMSWQYLFQLQYQMLCTGRKAGIITSLILPPEKDTPFNRGKITALIETGLFDIIQGEYDIEVTHSIYGIIPEMQNAIIEGLCRFEEMIANDILPEMNTAEPDLMENDFRIYQACYKNNPTADKLVTSQDETSINGESVNFHDFFNDFIGMNEIIKHNAKQDKLNKLIVKKYMMDNKLCRIYTLDGGECRLTKDGKLLVKS